MKYVQSLLKKELQNVEHQLSDERCENKAQKISAKKELTECLFAINILNEHGLDKSSIEKVISLPNSKTGYSEYRIIDDCESDSRENWVELFNDSPVRLISGDVIIIRKRQY